jgi:hypothetical protein
MHGGPVMATRTQFVFVDLCGCPLGVVEGSHAKTEAGAWRMWTHADDMRERGVTLVHVPHAEYVERFYPLMLVDCTHRTVAGA